MAVSARRRILEDSDEESVDSMDFDKLPTSGLTQRPSQSSQQSQSPTRAAPPPPPSSSSAPRPPPQHQHSALAARLENEGGVRPSPRWLDQCLRHVGNGNDDAVWGQILRMDLRDVVREGDATNASLETTPAQQLRNAMAQSRRTAGGNPNEAGNNGRPQSPKATLPSSFRLLVQVEEVVDASMNAEQQLAAMGGGNAAVAAVAANAGNRYNNNNGGGYQPGRNPKAATLKMTISDGYHADGRAFSSDGKENDLVLEAYAPAPIQRLSIASPPGTKLLLHGSIDIRVGLLQLSEGNCTVMGGEIEEWKGIWKKAREKAQREKGLGVDPTIKALIWNPLMGDEEEADEGEGESGDVTGAPAVPPPAFQAAPPAAPPVQPPHQSGNNANSNMHSYNANANAQAYNQNRNQSTSRPNNSYASAQNWNQNQSSSTASAPSRSTGGNNAASRNAGNMRQMTLDSYPKQPRPETTRLLPKDNAPSRQMAQQQISNNPYQHGGNSGSGGSNPYAGNRAPPQQQHRQQQRQQPQQQQQQRQQQPAMRSDVDVIPIDDSPPAAAARKPSPQQPKTNPYSSLRPPAKESAPVAAATASATFNSNPSFSELKSILQSMRSDRALYEQYYGKTFTVPCKIDGKPDGDRQFNIVKAGGEKKKGKSKKEKKYEFLLIGKFLGPKQSDGCIACRVDSSVLEPFFDGYSPAEIRKFSKEDRERANRIVNQGSQTFLHDYSSLGQVSMKLLLTADEFFTKTAQAPSGDGWLADTGNAFLLVTKRA